MKNVLHDISVQRNELRRVLGDLYDQVQHGAYNGMFQKSNPREGDVDPKSKCDKGHTRDEVIWCCGRICGDCHGCHRNCHLSFEEKRLFEAMAAALPIIRKQDAEMPSVSAKDFPAYDPESQTYQVTERWIARSLYRFAVGYWLFADHKDIENEKEWESAFDNLLSICLDAIGKDGKAYKTFITEVNRILKTFNDKGENKAKEQTEKLRDEHPEVVALIDEAVEAIYEKKDKAITIRKLVFLALTLRMDYQFGHKYPGGDMDVYDGAFCGLIDVALKIVGLDDDGIDEPWQQDGESKEDYNSRLAEAKAKHKDAIYSFMSETDGLTIQKL